MAFEKKRIGKTQSLSLRLDPKTKFILEFVARIRGQSITAVVERAIKDAADQVDIGDDEYGRNGRNWADFWDPNEGVRMLKLISDNNYPTSYDEDELRAFTMAHWPFFYVKPDGSVPKRGFIEILWPEIQKYLEIWQKMKTEDYWAAGGAMMADLSAARVATPDWPPQTSSAKGGDGGGTGAGAGSNLDDQIPF